MRLEEIKQLLLIWGMPSDRGIKELKAAIKEDKELSIFVPEMRPYLLGLEIVKIFQRQGIPHSYGTDNRLGLLFYKRKIKETIFFYKSVNKKVFSGICGSLYVCLLSALHHVPIRTLKGGEINLTSLAKDASSLNGYIFLKNQGAAIEAKDEDVPWEIIKPE
ncbi:MAG: hypothetical protein J7M03_01890 [Candidatus Desulfofervidaceae bacterium]|nr:hypothetical protein [Candidatus Desulfofervidaceae bacterium]